jgi:hypothetical protein
MKEKAWLLMGHSTLSSPVTKVVPPGVTLVLMAKCGRQFNKNNKFHKTLKSNNLINKYLEQNTNKNVYTSGNEYTNQFVQLETNNGLPHGLFQLPINIRAAQYRHSYIKGRPRISNVLSKVGNGVVIGMFCRGTPGVRKLRSGVKTVLNLNVRKSQKGPFGSVYNRLLAERKRIKAATKKPLKHVYSRIGTQASQRQVLNYGNL